MNLQSALQKILDGQNLAADEMRQVMHIIMSGAATPAQIGGFLIALRCKGESVDEIAAAAAVMRELAVNVPVSGAHIVDTCGTGGDGANTFNISTTCAFVVAAAGAQVPKHGNRSVSSRSGSADVLEAAGINLELTADQVAQCVAEIGVGFLFAPRHHNAMKHAIGPRKELGVRTIFNLLGPLSNPAAAPNQLIGVFSPTWLEPLAQVLKTLGSHHVLVVNAEDGLDEISIASATTVAELKDGEINCYQITPEQFGFKRSKLADLAVSDVNASLAIVLAVLNGKTGAARDIVSLNAGAAIYAAGIEDTLSNGIRRAQQEIDKGTALTKFNALIALSNSFKS